ncbi:MAG: hypothetical protein R2771_15525 [Saprospiraceae bacterium]
MLFPYILPFDMQVRDSVQLNQLELLTQYVENTEKHNPVIIVGEFNQVYWSKNLRNFIYNTKLNNARRFIYAFSDRNPYDHIFYSDDFNCYQIEDIFDPYTNLVGVKGVFEYKKIHDEITNN